MCIICRQRRVHLRAEVHARAVQVLDLACVLARLPARLGREIVLGQVVARDDPGDVVERVDGHEMSQTEAAK